MIKNTIKLSLFVFILASNVTAQTDSLNVPADTTNQNVFVMHKNPLTAVLLSAVLPGLGQIYNESYIKAPIIWGISAWLVYNWVINNNDYKTNKELFIQTGDERYRQLRTFFQDRRDQFVIYMGLVYLMNLIDAYVDAHLFDFTVDEDFMTNSTRLNIRFKF